MEEYSKLVSKLRMRHFDFLDRLGRVSNLGRVANEMNVAHSTATKMLQDIEDILGMILFIRNRRGIRATPAGIAMIKRAGLILSDLRSGHDELEVVHNGGTGKVRLGVFPVVAADFLPNLYLELGECLPGLKISIEEGDETRLAERLSDGKIDMILGRIEPSRLSPDLRHRVLYYEETVVICGAQNPIKRCDAGTLPRHTSEADWILPTSTTGASRLVTTWLVNAGFSPPRIKVESICPLVTVGLLSKTDLLGILPISVARTFIQLGLLKVLPINLPKTEFPVGLIYRRELESLPLIDALIECCDTISKRSE